jgi:hypothetical protein
VNQNTRTTFLSALGFAPTPQPNPAKNEPDPASESEQLGKIFADLEQTLGAHDLDRLIAPEDRKRACADPELAGRFVRNLTGWRNNHVRKRATEALEQAKADSAALAADRDRIIKAAREIATAESSHGGSPTDQTPTEPAEPTEPTEQPSKSILADFIRRNFLF